MEQVKNEPECVAASLSGNILVPKTLLLGIYLSQLIPKIHKKMVIDEPEKLQQVATVPMASEMYHLIFGTSASILINTEEEMNLIFGDQRTKEFSRGSRATIQSPVIFKHIKNTEKIEVSFYYNVINKRGTLQW
jgi:hypothetical protein